MLLSFDETNAQLLNLNFLSFNNNRAGDNSLNGNGNAGARPGAAPANQANQANQAQQNPFGTWQSALGAGLGRINTRKGLTFIETLHQVRLAESLNNNGNARFGPAAAPANQAQQNPFPWQTALGAGLGFLAGTLFNRGSSSPVQYGYYAYPYYPNYYYRRYPYYYYYYYYYYG
uniref:Bm12790 n=1 Tax=Brugia malayi TaxID=6279 RepID=A0A1I9G5V1_BRUMA|nr:Bm12790 [Brugia malayi]